MIKQETVKKAIELLRKRSTNIEYFFDQLKSPDWIMPLLAEGMFKEPPPPQVEEGYVSFPSWAESQYLARMAAISPEIVLDVIRQIPYTENVHVHEDLVDAACAMPAKLAASWAEREIEWVDKQQYIYFILPEKLATLMIHLAKSGLLDIALKLSKSLLTILPPFDDEIEKFRKYKVFPDPRARFDIWEYKDIINKQFKELAIIAGPPALSLLCDLLEDAIRTSRHQSLVEGSEDLSYIWRPAIEDNEQNIRDDLKSMLVEGLRDIAEALIESNGKIVLEIVEKRPFKIFHRIGLHLRRKWVGTDPEGTAIIASDPKVFDDHHLHHEYFLLLGQIFASLPIETQQGYLALVAAGPNVKEWIDNAEEFSGKRPDAEEAEKYFRYWQYQKLWPIRGFLDGDWLHVFQAFHEEFKDPEHPDFHYYHGATWVGPTSPKSIDNLRAMNFDELIAFLTSWKAPSEPMSPSPEGLGRNLSSLVELEPERFAIGADRFKGLDPTYVRWLLHGLQSAVGKVAFSWAPVMDLCRWVLNQPREIPGRKAEYSNLDPGWVWTRKAIASLLEVGFNQSITEIPIVLRTEVWEILRPLTDDPEPTPEYEAEYGGSNMDPATLSINTTRGVAIHAVIRYALWVRRYIENLPDGEQRLARGFGEMSEVLEILDSHLDLEKDSALSVRSVYGRWYPWLVLLDENWASINVEKIFPSDTDLQSLWKAAWDSYIIFCRPYDNVFPIIYKQYSKAIERLGEISEQQKSIYHPDERLTEHLMILYWRGKIGLEDSAGLLEDFYARAPVLLKAHAIGFIGRSFRNHEVRIEADVLHRIMALWEKRIADLQKETTPDRYDELVPFGWWSVSGKFDPAWALKQLEGTLKLTHKIEPDHLVVEYLASLATSSPLDAVECLALILKDDKKPYRHTEWRQHARIILASALQGTDEQARKVAAELIHQLGARREFWEFRDLLSSSKESY